MLVQALVKSIQNVGKGLDLCQLREETTWGKILFL